MMDGDEAGGEKTWPDANELAGCGSLDDVLFAFAVGGVGREEVQLAIFIQQFGKPTVDRPVLSLACLLFLGPEDFGERFGKLTTQLTRWLMHVRHNLTLADGVLAELETRATALLQCARRRAPPLSR